MNFRSEGEWKLIFIHLAFWMERNILGACKVIVYVRYRMRTYYYSENGNEPIFSGERKYIVLVSGEEKK